MNVSKAVPRAGRRGLAGLALLGVLAGCATGVPVERVVVVDGSRFDNVQGEAGLTVRTFTELPGDERAEVLGARCSVLTTLYTAELVTPARLRVPGFGPQSPELEITCNADGLSGSATVQITTNWRYPPGLSPYTGVYGPYGPYVYGGVRLGGRYGAGAVPVSKYPNANILLR